ncbi:MAG: formate--tetrahydrofolate ligase [Deltaproteobacteria bacterium]|nr:MAG: formate--tetrahydrofolate ligase [Deltaproteobacteria bacterium]
MKTDVEIAQSVQTKPIEEIAASLGVSRDDLHPYGRDKAKIDLSVLDKERKRDKPSRLVLVSAITPTPAGEGKTTTTIGLGQAMAQIGESVCLALREPSLGPCMGIKGGAAGGGYSQVVPADSINLHFTGDFHAITSAHNTLAAVLDNHIHFGNALNIDTRRVLWPRVMDMNDRSLRNIVVGLGGVLQGVPREAHFDITAASEIMAILCLSQSLEDLRQRLDRILVAYTVDKQPVLAGQLNATGAMMALLRDAMMPNLVQTLEGTPALVHGGPFANIAHGCNSVLATKMAMHLADWTITEAGFGFDLGGEKFFDIKCAGNDLDVAAVVLVTTVRALKMHGGKKKNELTAAAPDAVERGLPNLERHLDSIRHFGKRPIVALNRFHHDTDDEIEVIRQYCQSNGVAFAESNHFAEGGRGAVALAELLVQEAEKDQQPLRPTYQREDSPEEKIRAVAQSVYGARDVVFSKRAKYDLGQVRAHGYENLPICIAKTQSSLSDDPSLLGRPEDFDITVQQIQINSGAGFLVVLTGDIVRMPGLPKSPQSERIDVVDGVIVGLQ